MNYNNPELIKYIISNMYGLKMSEMRNFQILKDYCTYNKSDTEKYSISLDLIKDIISQLRNLGCENKSQQRVGFVLESNIIMYFLSSFYIEYRLFCNFIKILNHNNIGVDLITDSNIITMLPDELKELDLTLFFSTKNKTTNSVEKNLYNSINDYFEERPTTIRCISDTTAGTKALIDSKIPNNKKLLLLHAQKLLNFPINDNIKDRDNEVFEFLELLEQINFNIAVTSQALLDKLKQIEPNKNYNLVKELGYTVKDAEDHLYPQRKFQTKNLIIKFTNLDDLEYCFKGIKPLNYFISVLIDNLDDKQLVDYFMKNNNYDNYVVRKSTSYDILKNNYNIAIDFSNEIIIPYECNVICDEHIEKKDNLLPVDKTNPILIIKNILLSSQQTYGIMEDNSSFIPKEEIDEEIEATLKTCVI